MIYKTFLNEVDWDEGWGSGVAHAVRGLPPFIKCSWGLLDGNEEILSSKRCPAIDQSDKLALLDVPLVTGPVPLA